jgi:predicted TIM-barrel fold metal-dependent hydrolase
VTKVDTHLHAYRDAAQGRYETSAYPIVEYGDRDGVRFSERAGTVPDAVSALDDAGIDYAAMLGSFELPQLPHPPGGARHWPADPVHPERADELRDYNRWLCGVGRRHRRLLPFVTVNPAVMTAGQSAAHVRELIDGHGARGMKLHTIAIRTYPDDPGLAATFATAQDAGIPVVVHSGPDSCGYDWATPRSFAAVAADFPRLRLVLAHLGGATWRETAELAHEFDHLWFDLSEIVMWTNATNGPSPRQLAGLITDVGVERVVTGSDFPWYEPADTVAAVEALPLSDDAKRAVLGENAIRLIGLDALKYGKA